MIKKLLGDTVERGRRERRRQRQPGSGILAEAPEGNFWIKSHAEGAEKNFIAIFLKLIRARGKIFEQKSQNKKLSEEILDPEITKNKKWSSSECEDNHN